MDKLFKEVPNEHYGTHPVEVTEEEVKEQWRKYANGEKHEHVFGHDKYAASGYYERKCIICGHIDYI